MTTITAKQYDSLRDEIYSSLIKVNGMGLADIGELEAAGKIPS